MASFRDVAHNRDPCLFPYIGLGKLGNKSLKIFKNLPFWKALNGWVSEWSAQAARGTSWFKLFGLTWAGDNLAPGEEALRWCQCWSYGPRVLCSVVCPVPPFSSTLCARTVVSPMLFRPIKKGVTDISTCFRCHTVFRVITNFVINFMERVVPALGGAPNMATKDIFPPAFREGNR